MNLYEKYRPQTLEDVYGNEELKKDLMPFVTGKRDLPAASMFIGPSGCGKTTLARILLRAIGCSDIDITELDSADFRGIDTVRSETQKMKLAPIGGKKRGWIFDECHKLTNDAQNALLKSLEKPPRNVHIILCTTDPQMMIKTIITRCTPFAVEPLATKDLMEILKDVAWGELGEDGMKEIPNDAYKMIAKQANSSGRAAITMLERVLGREPSEYEQAIASFEDFETTIKDLCGHLLKQTAWKSLAGIVGGIKEEPEKVRRAVLGYMSAVLLSGKDSAQAAVIIECFKEPFYNTGAAGLTLACYYATLKQ